MPAPEATTLGKFPKQAHWQQVIIWCRKDSAGLKKGWGKVQLCQTRDCGKPTPTCAWENIAKPYLYLFFTFHTVHRRTQHGRLGQHEA